MKSKLVNKRMLEVLRTMIASEEAGEYEEAEIVREGRSVWLGYERLSSATVNRLIGVMAIKAVSEPGSIDRFAISGTGRAIVKDPSVADKVVNAVYAGVSVDEKGDPIDTILDPP